MCFASYVEFSGKSSDLIGRKVRVVMEDNEGDFPLATGLVKLSELHWHVIGRPGRASDIEL